MITFYPTVSCGEIGKYSLIPCALLPASSWAGSALRNQERRGLPTDHLIGRIPVPRLPDCMTHIAADCGGFVAAKKWGGVYKYSVEQYVEWLDAIRPEWAAMMDLCCEKPITDGKQSIVRQRQQWTTGMAYRLWDEYQHKPFVWVPTVQGWDVKDYIKHAREMLPLIREMHAFYQARGQTDLFRVGIGTLCARASADMIQQVVLEVSSELPGIPLHLWGVKLSVFKSPIALPEHVVSVDSAAWNGLWADGRERWKRSPYTQREWCFEVALPEYQAKVKEALSQQKRKAVLMPQQLDLFGEGVA